MARKIAIVELSFLFNSKNSVIHSYLYNKYINYWNLQLLNNAIINKTKVLLPKAKVTVVDFGYLVSVLWFYCSQSFQLFFFPMFRFCAYVMKAMPETRRAYQIWYLLFFLLKQKQLEDTRHERNMP